MAIIWDTIHTNFKNLMEDGTTGVNSLTSVTTNFAEADDIDLKALAGSIFDGAYSIQLESINSVLDDIGTGKLDFDYSVKLQVGFEMGQTTVEYNEIISDIEEIIRKRLDDSTYSDPILLINFISSSKPSFVDRQETERYGIAEILFKVIGRVYLTN